MDIFWLFIRWIHVIAAVVWIGGNLILAMVIVPHFRQNLPPVQRIQILTLIGKRFEPIVWLCVLILFFTGIVNIFNSVDLSATNDSLLVGTFWRTLVIKLLLFFILLILTGLHSLFYGPKLSKAIEDLDPETEELPVNVNSIRKQMAIVSSAMGVVSLLIILAAVALRMGI
ncbi:hypothetical protein F4083_06080 [Candidatus Poribacteria bacterium]|nr:hypothetical protein [Candidatus Poribacteria bacterium]MYB64958.1 hypothetical protein [Candidatus Poribacteria bacterium]MYI93878.1 hypothetical protein [Candidatus Poribacteria bacterium]